MKQNELTQGPENENLAREALIKSLGVMKHPGVENLPTVIVLGEMHVLPLDTEEHCLTCKPSYEPSPS